MPSRPRLNIIDPSLYVAIGNWLVGGDDGISSVSMVAIALGATKGDFDAPHDTGDFGRCYRLVAAIPQIKSYFPRIGELVPAFAGILDEWDDLVEIYLRDSPSGRSDELYKRIKELRGDQ